jgi:hypothetical protein
MKFMKFWNVTLCILAIKSRCFGETCPFCSPSMEPAGCTRTTLHTYQIARSHILKIVTSTPRISDRHSSSVAVTFFWMSNSLWHRLHASLLSRRSCLMSTALCVLCFGYAMRQLLGAFAKLEKVTITFVIPACLPACPSVHPSLRPSVSPSVPLIVQPSVSPSVRLHETTRLPLNVFSWNLMFKYRKSVEKIQVYYYLTITGTLHEDLRTIMVISRWILLRFRNVSNECCRENQNTHFMFNNFFPKIVPFMR